jgi:hypothetical protein
LKPAERDDWVQEIQGYPRFLEQMGALEMIPEFREARDQQARADRLLYEGGPQEDQPQVNRALTDSAALVRSMMNSVATHPRREEIVRILAPLLGMLER